MSDEMTQNQATLIGEGISLRTPNTLPDAVKSPTWNADGTFNGWAAPVSPAGVGTELQYRDEDEFGAVAGSSFVGGVLTVASLASDGVVSTGIDGYLSVFGSAFFGLHGGLPYIGSAIPGSAEANDDGMNFSGSALFLTSAGGLVWHSGDLSSGFDVGLSRNAAATLQVDDLSGGRGDFVARNSTQQYSATDAASSSLLFKKSRGTVASPLAITPPDQLGAINFQGYSGAAGYVTGAQIRAVSEGTIATTRVPTKLVFATGTDAAPTVLTESLTINSAGVNTFKSPSGNSCGLRLDTSSAGTSGYIYFYQNGTNTYQIVDSTVYDGLALLGMQSGSVDLFIHSSGKVGVNKSSSLTGQFNVTSSGSTIPGITVTGATSHSAALVSLVQGGGSPTGNFISCTSNGGVDGNLFKVASTGNVTVAGSESGGNILGRIRLGANGTGLWNTGGADLILSRTGAQNVLINSIGEYRYGDRVLGWASLPDTGGDLGSQTFDLILGRGGAATLQMGANAAVAVHQTFKAHDAVGTNIVAANFYAAPGRSTGSGTPASYVIQGTVAEASGSAVQTLANVVTVTNGMVGIGTNPSNTFHVLSANSEFTRLGRNSPSGAGSIGVYQDTFLAIALGYMSSAGNGQAINGIVSAGVIRGTTGLHLVAGDSIPATSGITIVSGGKVGIGIIAPTSQLQVVQSATTVPGISVDGITNQSVPLLALNMGATPTGNVVAITTSGGTEGGLYKITAAGDHYLAGSSIISSNNATTRTRFGNADLDLENDNVGRYINLTTNSGLIKFIGTMHFGTHTGLAAETVTGYITIKDAGGTDRKLAVVS